MDYFKDCNTREETYAAIETLEVEEKIHDSLPVKYQRWDFSNPAMSYDAHDSTKAIALREKFTDIGMYAFVTWKWVNPLAEWIGNKKCLEVMAGRGWLSSGLRQKGVDIIATDDFSWHKQDWRPKWKTVVTDIEELDAVAAVKKYGADIDYLVMSWPYMDDTAYRVLKELHEVNPAAQVIYIGEHGGCTADDSFFEHFQIIKNDSFDLVAMNYERWFGINDFMFLGRYTEEIIEDEEE